ncbi:MAG: DUF2096 family protein [Candidatus Bathyarchaeota archaeon]|nr:DUF2096 family protein [Candidatus Bathyarchaeota archaeon]
MGYNARSQILETIIIALRKKGVTIPETVLGDLKAARVLLKVMSASQKDLGETAQKIEEYLGSVEAYLITEAQKNFAAEKVEEWLRLLEQATIDECGCTQVELDKPKEETRFMTGVPRDQKWIRIEPMPTLPLYKLEELVTQTNLSFREEPNGQLTVYGSPENIKIFVKKLAALTKTG